MLARNRLPLSIFLPLNKADRTMDKQTIAQNIEKLRTNAGITQEELAERAGISRTSIRNILTAEVNIINRHLPAIAAALGVSLEELLLGYEPFDPDSGLLRSEASHQAQLHDLADDFQKRLDELQSRYDLLEELCASQRERIRLLEQINGMDGQVRREND